MPWSPLLVAVSALLISLAGSALAPAVAATARSAEWDRLQKAEEKRHLARWELLRQGMFADKQILDGEGVLEMAVTKVPPDPATVPIKIRALIPQTKERFIKKITVLVDQNPSPLAAVFHLTERSGKADVSTRIRVGEFSYVRAVAELNDGTVYMTKGFVKASGGCDTAPNVDQKSVLERLGKMRLRLPGGAQSGKTSVADLLIQHPNYNGMQQSDGPGTAIPLRVLQEVVVSYADETILRIEGHLSLSSDPKFRFHYVAEDSADLRVRLVDSEEAKFQQVWPVKVEASE